MCFGEIMSVNLIQFLEEYQSIITAIVITSMIIYILIERWLERRKFKSTDKESVKNKKR